MFASPAATFFSVERLKRKVGLDVEDVRADVRDISVVDDEFRDRPVGVGLYDRVSVAAADIVCRVLPREHRQAHPVGRGVRRRYGGDVVGLAVSDSTVVLVGDVSAEVLRGPCGQYPSGRRFRRGEGDQLAYRAVETGFRPGFDQDISSRFGCRDLARLCVVGLKAYQLFPTVSQQFSG